MANPLSVVDTHVHLWDPDYFPMPWLESEPVLKRAYRLQTYFEHTNSFPIDALVFMECGVEPQYAFLEAQWAVGLGQQNTRVQGVIAAAPVEFGSRLRSYLEALSALGPLVKGIRRNIQDESDERFCLQPAFVQGVQLATEQGFSFDLCIRRWQLPVATQLVRQCPQTRFMLDHLGKPAVFAGQIDLWQQQIRELAALPNVFCKISGLLSEIDVTTWDETDLAPYILHIWECFGEDRVVFAGDWPMMLTTTTYARWFAALQTILAPFSTTALHKFWQGNARAFYRLSVPTGKE